VSTPTRWWEWSKLLLWGADVLAGVHVSLVYTVCPILVST
jgi:hypothetical protein